MIRRFISNIRKSIYWITFLIVFNQFLSNANINPQISALNLLSTSKNKKWTQKKIKTKSKIPRYTKKDSRALSTMNEKQKNNSKSHHQSRPPNTKIACPYLRISTKHNHLFLGHYPNPRINEKEKEQIQCSTRKLMDFSQAGPVCSWRRQLQTLATCQLHPEENYVLRRGGPDSRDEGSRNSGPRVESLALSATTVLRTSPGGVFLGPLSVRNSYGFIRRCDARLAMFEFC